MTITPAATIVQLAEAVAHFASLDNSLHSLAADINPADGAAIAKQSAAVTAQVATAIAIAETATQVLTDATSRAERATVNGLAQPENVQERTAIAKEINTALDNAKKMLSKLSDLIDYSRDLKKRAIVAGIITCFSVAVVASAAFVGLELLITGTLTSPFWLPAVSFLYLGMGIGGALSWAVTGAIESKVTMMGKTHQQAQRAITSAVAKPLAKIAAIERYIQEQIISIHNLDKTSPTMIINTPIANKIMAEWEEVRSQIQSRGIVRS